MELGMYMDGVDKTTYWPKAGGWAAPRGNPNECTTCVIQSDTGTGYKLAARFREALMEIGEPYVVSDGVATMHLWVRPGVWEVFESYYKSAFNFAGLTLTEYMRSMLK